ncbi:hypothetical protein [Microbacterium sp.]|uniref:hypothetical protein n=1 Tax=Microbacterium sp. TaxID=51671 RepID=UPI0039E369E1
MLTLAPTYPVRECPIVLWRTAEVPHPERGARRGDLTRVRRGVYARTADWRRLPPWEKYLVRVHAAALVFPDAVFSHESAAVLLGMPVLGDPVTVHVLVGPHSAARESTGIRSHRCRELPEVVTSRGIAVTSPAVTAVTLARHRHNAYGLAAADAALGMGKTLTREALIADNEARDSSRGRNLARWPLERADKRRESVLESISDAAIEWLGFPAPELQHVFVAEDGRIDRGDKWWKELSLLGEPDGELKYDGRFGDPAALLRDRHERDRRLLRGDVDSIAHWGWLDVARIWPLRALLLGHGLRQLYPEDTVQLRSLTRLLAPYERSLGSASPTPVRERTTRGRENGW